MILSQCISLVESNDNPDAIRFEPELYLNCPDWITNTISNIAEKNICSTDTAKMIACSSWGKYQILGANIYAQGFANNIMDFVFDGDQSQETIFNKFITTGGFDWRDNLGTWSQEQFENFARFYNGPGNFQNYAAKMMEITK